MKKDMISHWLPCPVVFVGAEHGEKRDIMTATAMFVSEREPIFIVSLSSGHLTAKLVAESGSFVISLASEGQRNLALQLGSTHGEKTDKWAKFAIERHPDGSVPALVPKDCAAWMVCEVIGEYESEGYTLFLGRVKSEGQPGGKALIWQKDAFYGLKTL